jgi:serine/threonine protein phosphatase 1
VVHVGDLVDRGPDSRGVIQFLIDGIGRGENWVALKGNHDQMFADFLESADAPVAWDGADWLRPTFGGAATLASYGLGPIEGRSLTEIHAEALTRVPEAHREFLAGLKLWFRAGEAVFVHAGIRPGVAMEAQDEEDLIWIRAPFLFDTTDHGALIVHGHTPVDEVTHYGNRLDIDTGAGFGRALSAVAVEGRRAWLLTPEGREPLWPVTGLR